MYVNELEVLAKQYINNTLSLKKDRKILDAVLDGGPNLALRTVVSTKKLQETGTYFTGDILADLALKNYSISNIKKIYDPACGVGDLLISAARKLPISKNLTETLNSWGDILHGYDLHSEFIRATKIRLILTALKRGVAVDSSPIQNINNLFPNLQVKNGLQVEIGSSTPTWILLNPPFYSMKTPLGCKWASGKVSAAALFLDKWIDEATPQTKIIAILPDVLRSGSFYEHWRRNIASKAKINKIQIYGKFDALTEVDVFILTLTVSTVKTNKLNYEWWEKSGDNKSTVGDFFDITVGRVVPYRDPEEGKLYDYIQPKTLPKWEMIDSLSEQRRFSGLVSEPPFVAMRRNSRSDDKYRASGTIINTSKLTAVENHLIVLKPRDGKLSTCEKLLSILKTADTNKFLNQRIRCRHLTVPSVKDIPWIE